MTSPKGNDDLPEVIDHLREAIDSLAGHEQAVAEIRNLHALID